MGISIQQNATIVDRIRNIHGSGVANELIEIQTASDQWGFKANGLVSNANYHAKKLAMLLFINHRSVDSSNIKKAIDQAYSVFLPKGSHPFVYLSLEIEPHRVDVNVHPTKREVNFLYEDEIIDTVCGEIRNKLGKVDTSRTFMTQSLLPGVKIPTISVDSTNTPRKNTNDVASIPTPASSTPTQALRTSASKPYENNLVRTDAKLRKITSMLPPTQRHSPTVASEGPGSGAFRESARPSLPSEDSMTYSYTSREPTLCRLTSVKALRASVREAMHANLTEVLTTHTFVGVVDEHRRIAAIQSGVKLFLVDYGLICNEYFYQVGLTDFGNFGSIRIDPPLPLKEILQIGASREMEASTDADELDWDEVVETVLAHLLTRREMLNEYFSLEVSEDANLLSLPLLVKGYMPSMAKLPRFLLRLGPHVDWTDEEACFRTFLRELAGWYTPESMPPLPGSKQPRDDVAMSEGDYQTISQPEAASKDSDDGEISARRDELNRSLETVLFPAFKARLIATKGMLKGVVEIANLKGLYRVFERC